ncbi:MAG: hypothetical protein ABSA17_07310 [Rhabdochlamydiaceae bacterium]
MTLEAMQQKLKTPPYSHHEYVNDFGGKEAVTQSNLLIRVAFAAVPFISMYRPLGFYISIGMCTVRVASDLSKLFTLSQNGTKEEIRNQSLQTVISVTALAASVFAHPAGMLITTGQDIIVDSMSLIHDFNKENYTKALDRSVSLCNNAIYLGLFFSSSLQLSIASLSIQIALGLYHSSQEFRNGHWIEGSSNLLMSAIRVKQVSNQIQLLQVKWQFQKTQRSLEKVILVETSQTECALDASNKNDLSEIQAVKADSNSELTKILIEYGNNTKGYSAITWATHLGHEDIVKKLIAHGVDHKKAYAPGVGNLLDVALENKHLSLADYYVKNGINACNPMPYFQEENNLPVWEFLEKHRLLENCKNVNWLALCLQRKGSISGIKFLVEHGADCTSRVNISPYNNHPKPGKDSPGILTVARDYGKFQPEFIKFLVDHGAPINTNLESNTSWDPFFQVISASTCSQKKEEMEKWNTLIKDFIDRGAKWPNDGSNHSGKITFISTATHNQNLDVILLMSKVCDCLEHSSITIQNPGFTVNQPKNYLMTPLQYAVFKNRIDDARSLLEHGANPNNIGAPNFLTNPGGKPQNTISVSIFSKTPLSIAIQNKSADLINLLLKFGAIIP